MSDNITGNPTGYTPPAHAIEGSLNGSGKKIGIICAKFNERITKSLLMGAITGLTEHGVSESNIVTHWVPGAFEVPVVAETIFPKSPIGSTDPICLIESSLFGPKSSPIPFSLAISSSVSGLS